MESSYFRQIYQKRLKQNMKYSKTPLLRPPIDLRKNGLSIGVVLLLSEDKEEINEMGL